MAVKILSVDDEQQMASLMRQYFRRKIRSGEYEFLSAYNGRDQEVIEMVNQGITDFVRDAEQSDDSTRQATLRLATCWPMPRICSPATMEATSMHRLYSRL